MAEKLPLVIGTDGVVEEIQSGDTLGGSISGEVKDLMDFDSGAALAIRDAVYIDAAGKLQKAQADAASTLPCRGFTTVVAAAVDIAVKLQARGLLAGFSGMTPGAKQYVDPSNAGLLVETITTTTGEFVQEVGEAKSASILLIDIKHPIKRG